MTNDRIDLNRADVATLAALPGIGEALARRIVAYRETVHPFEEVIELAAVPGISERMVRLLEDRVTVDAPAAVSEQELEPERDEVQAPLLEPTVAPLSSTVATAMATTEPPVPETEVEVEESEPVIVNEAPEPEPARPTPPPAAPAAPRSQSRGCLFLILGTILGAVTGALLTLATLAALNGGTLFFAQTDAQLQRDLDDARQSQTDLASEVNTLTGQLSAMATRAGETAVRQGQMDEVISDIEGNVTDTQVDLSTLEATAAELDERLSTVAESAETFDTFLDTLRDLLVDLQGLPPTPTATPTLPSPTPLTTTTPIATSSPTTTGAAATTATPTMTALATRTPRPTATPLALPATAMPTTSPTPVQQP